MTNLPIEYAIPTIARRRNFSCDCNLPVTKPLDAIGTTKESAATTASRSKLSFIEKRTTTNEETRNAAIAIVITRKAK